MAVSIKQATEVLRQFKEEHTEAELKELLRASKIKTKKTSKDKTDSGEGSEEFKKLLDQAIKEKGLKGAREIREKFQIAKYGTTKKYENILQYVFGAPAGGYFRKYLEQKASPEQQEEAKKLFGMDDKTKQRKAEEKEREDEERKAKREARRAERKAAGGKGIDQATIDAIFGIKRLVEGIAKVILVKRGFKAEIDQEGRVVFRSTKEGSKGQYAKESEASAVFSPKKDKSDTAVTPGKEPEAINPIKDIGMVGKFINPEDPQERIANSLKQILKSLGKDDTFSIHEKLDILSHRKSGSGLGFGDLFDVFKSFRSLTSIFSRALPFLEAIAPFAAAAAGAVGITYAAFKAIDENAEEQTNKSTAKNLQSSPEDLATAFTKGYHPDFIRADAYNKAAGNPELLEKLHQADLIVMEEKGVLPAPTIPYVGYEDRIKEEVQAKKDKKTEDDKAYAEEQTRLGKGIEGRRKIAAERAAAAKLAEDQRRESYDETGGYESSSETTSGKDGTEFTQVSPGEDGKLLDFIGNIESRGNYNSLVGGQSKSNPALTDMTVADVLDFQLGMIKSGHESSAVGKYQIIRKTLEGIVDSGAISLNDKFDPETQDKAAMKLLSNRGRDKFKRGEITAAQYMDNLAQEWASLPMSDGRSYYAGVGSNRALTTRVDFSKAISAKQGGIVSGPESGYPATLHGNEMIIPLQKDSLLANMGNRSAQELAASQNSLGQEMMFQTRSMQDSEMESRNSMMNPIVLNNVQQAPIQMPSQKTVLSEAGTRNDESSFTRALARDFSHPTAFTTVGTI